MAWEWGQGLQQVALVMHWSIINIISPLFPFWADDGNYNWRGWPYSIDLPLKCSLYTAYINHLCQIPSNLPPTLWDLYYMICYAIGPNWLAPLSTDEGHIIDRCIVIYIVVERHSATVTDVMRFVGLTPSRIKFYWCFEQNVPYSWPDEYRHSLSETFFFPLLVQQILAYC